MPQKKSSKQEHDERLSAALRENLKRRRAQAKARENSAPEQEKSASCSPESAKPA